MFISLFFLASISFGFDIQWGVAGGAGVTFPKIMETLKNDGYDADYRTGYLVSVGQYLDIGVFHKFSIRPDLTFQFLSTKEKTNEGLGELMEITWWRIALGTMAKYQVFQKNDLFFGPLAGFAFVRTDGWKIYVDESPDGFRFDFPYYAPLLRVGAFGSYKRIGLDVVYAWMPKRWSKSENGTYPLVNDLSISLSYRIFGGSK